jgi:hypothetical protein
MWTPSQGTYSVVKTTWKISTASDGSQAIHVELDVANIPVNAKPELWLYPSTNPPNQDPPAALQAKTPTLKSLAGGLTAVSHSFPMDPTYHGQTFIPIVGTVNDGNNGSAFQVP